MNAKQSFSACAESSSIVIARRGMACLENVRGAQLRVVRGSAWVTQSGSTDDVCLDAGELFRITRNGLTLVSSCHRWPFALVMLEPSVAVTPTPGERLRKFCSALLAPPSRPTTAAL